MSLTIVHEHDDQGRKEDDLHCPSNEKARDRTAQDRQMLSCRQDISRKRRHPAAPGVPSSSFGIVMRVEILRA